MESAAKTTEGKERHLLMQADLQRAVISLQSRVIAGADPLPVLADFVRLLVDITGSEAGGALEAQAGQPASWQVVADVHLAGAELADAAGLILASLAGEGSLAVDAPRDEVAATDHSNDLQPILARLQTLRPGLRHALLLRLPGTTALLCLFDRKGGYDPALVDSLRWVADIGAQFLAASRRSQGRC